MQKEGFLIVPDLKLGPAGRPRSFPNSLVLQKPFLISNRAAIGEKGTSRQTSSQLSRCR
jgi:hypothetical protein